MVFCSSAAGGGAASVFGERLRFFGMKIWNTGSYPCTCWMPHLQPAPEPHSDTKTWLKANGAPFQTLQQNGGFELCQHNTRGFGFLYELLLVFTKINLNDFCCKLSSSKPDKTSVEGFVFYLNIGQAGSPKIWFLILTLLGSNTETLIQWVSINCVPCTRSSELALAMCPALVSLQL